MAIEIPILAGANAFEQVMQLDGDKYTLTFRWNARASLWFMDIADGEGTAIVQGIAVVVGSLTHHLRTRSDMPPGVFVAYDTTDVGHDPGFAELGERVKLVYLEESET